MHILIISLSMLLLLPAQVQADGNLLLEDCLMAEEALDSKKMSDPIAAGQCLGFVEAANQTMRFMQLMPNANPPLACFPENGLQNSQAIRIVLSYLKSHPEKLHQTKVSLAINSFIDAFPCR